MEAKLKHLAICLLDSDDGISEEAYKALLDVLPEKDALTINNVVDAADGRFYLPEDHNLQDWRTAIVPS